MKVKIIKRALQQLEEVAVLFRIARLLRVMEQMKRKRRNQYAVAFVTALRMAHHQKLMNLTTRTQGHLFTILLRDEKFPMRRSLVKGKRLNQSVLSLRATRTLEGGNTTREKKRNMGRSQSLPRASTLLILHTKFTKADIPMRRSLCPE